MTTRALEDEPLASQTIERDALAELLLECAARVFEMLRRDPHSIYGFCFVQRARTIRAPLNIRKG